MKQINDFQDALNYVNRLGFAGSGNIAYRQQSLCTVVDALVKTAGGYPFKASLTRYKSPAGYVFPWLSIFEVRTSDGKYRDLDMSQVKM